MLRKDRKVTFVCDEEELDMLREMADAEQRSASNWLRQAIRTAHAAKFGAKKEGGRKPARKPKR